jgi:hypothetical protein
LDENPNVAVGELDVLPGAGPDVIVVTAAGALGCFELASATWRHFDA